MFETIVKWGMVGLMAFSALVTVTAVGKPRKPLTGGTAAGIVLFNGAWITAIVTLWD